MLVTCLLQELPSEAGCYQLPASEFFLEADGGNGSSLAASCVGAVGQFGSRENSEMTAALIPVLYCPI